MRRLLANALHTLAAWLSPKAIPTSLAGNQWTGTTFVDAFKRERNPTPNELMAELKGTAWTCASINASVCATFPPRLYVATDPDQPAARCLTAALDRRAEQRLRQLPQLPPRLAKAQKIEEVLDHPLLTLLRQVNPVHNSFDLWELTQLYLEVHGRAFWYLVFDPVLHIPREIWTLPAQNVTPRRRSDSPRLIDYYEYRTGAREQRFRPDEIIFFRFPDPRDPYLGGLSPLRACYEQIALLSDFAAFKQAKFENHAIPDALVTPEAVIGEEERDRLQAQWNSYFRRGGTGRVVVTENAMRLQVLSHSMGDLAALADMKATKEDVSNAFHVPLSFLTSETNLANLQAAEHQHMAKAIGPRLQRRDQKLNEQLLPLYDPTGRLFVASEDPVPVNFENNMKELELKLKFGVLSINEVRQAEGLDPVPWGNTPWLPLQWASTDYAGRADTPAPDTGRNRREP
jgi:HK97 family phage portal protein